MTDNNETPTKLPPTAFAQTIAQALAERHTERGQSIKYGAPATGTFAGKILPSDVNVPRDPDETHDQWFARQSMILRDALKLCLVFNDENYRDELLREALQEIRSAEDAKTLDGIGF